MHAIIGENLPSSHFLHQVSANSTVHHAYAWGSCVIAKGYSLVCYATSRVQVVLVAAIASCPGMHAEPHLHTIQSS